MFSAISHRAGIEFETSAGKSDQSKKELIVSKKVLLVGHCGPDSSYLRMAVKSAGGNVTMLAADDDLELREALDAGVDLVLFNRELGYGFEVDKGVDVIRSLKAAYPNTKMMLVSNYPDAQAAAVAAGALPGFGKRDIGSAKATRALQEALSTTAAAKT